MSNSSKRFRVSAYLKSFGWAHEWIEAESKEAAIAQFRKEHQRWTFETEPTVMDEEERKKYLSALNAAYDAAEQEEEKET